MKRIIVSLFLMVVFLSNVYSQEQQEEQLFDKVAIVINSEPIMKSDVEFAKQWYNVATEDQAQEKIIDSVLVYQQALKMGISVSPKDVEQAILSIANANNIATLEEFKKKLSEEGISYEKLKEFIKRDLVVNRFLQLYLRQSVSKGVIEGELQDVKSVRIIFIQKSKEDYNRIIKELDSKLNKDNFGLLAKEYSDDKFTAENSGILGEVKRGDLLKELDEEVFKHKAGDIFKVQTDGGTYYVYIEKEDRKLLSKENFEKDSIEKFKKDYQIYLKKLREQAVIQRL